MEKIAPRTSSSFEDFLISMKRIQDLIRTDYGEQILKKNFIFLKKQNLIQDRIATHQMILFSLTVLIDLLEIS